MRLASLSAFLLCSLAVPAQQASPDNLLQQAAAARDHKDFRHAADLLQQALPLVTDPDRASTEYDLACDQALAAATPHDRDTAFATLQHAVDDGYVNRSNAENDPDLASLHADPRWSTTLQAMTFRKQQDDQRWGDIAFAAPTPTPTNPNPGLSPADKVAALSLLWAHAKFDFANFWHVPTLDWDQTYRDFLPKVLATTSTEDTYRVLQRFYALLQDGHTNVYSPALVAGKLDRLPLTTELLDNHLIVTRNTDPSLAIQPGDEVLSINNTPALTFARASILPYVSASSPQDRDLRGYNLRFFFQPLGTIVTLVIASPSGRQHTLSIPIRDVPHAETPAFSLRTLPGNIALVTLNAFEDESVDREWDAHWSEIQRAHALILDLRDNGGGSSRVGYHILGSLLTAPTATELSRSTRWIATYRAWGLPQTPERFPIDSVQPDPTRHFAGPVAVLTSPRTFSAAEDFAIAFQQSHRGALIGQPTGGSSGQPLTFKLPGGGVARICTKHDSFADEQEFVGVGVLPTVPTRITRDDILRHRDPTLAAALQWLSTQSAVQPASAITTRTP